MEREVLEGKLLIRLHWELSKPFKDEKGKSLALGGKEQFFPVSDASQSRLYQSNSMTRIMEGFCIVSLRIFSMAR